MAIRSASSPGERREKCDKGVNAFIPGLSSAGY
jgi:hypothetical protein